jgi:DMSO reductase anchor subunit
VFALALLALGASLLHLGRPHLAFRAVLGLRRSWLSREIVTFGGFAGTAALDALRPSPALGAIASALGLAGVVSSVMVYAATRRATWSTGIVGAKFALTTAILGVATTRVVIAATSGAPGFLPDALLASIVTKIVLELALLSRARDRDLGALPRSARLQLGPLRRVLLARLGAAALALVAASIDATAPSLAVASIALAAALAGELCERHLFFVAVGSPRMPGAVR